MLDVEDYIKNTNLKITRLPNDLNPNIKLREAINDKYGICPYCGKKTDSWHRFTKHKYIRLDNKWWQFWKSPVWCEKKEYVCPKCGTLWESPWYPDDIAKLK